MQLRKRMVGVGDGEGKLAVGQAEPRLTSSTLEMVQGVALGFNDEGEMVGAMDVNGLSGERQEHLAWKMIKAGMAILEGRQRLSVH